MLCPKIVVQLCRTKLRHFFGISFCLGEFIEQRMLLGSMFWRGDFSYPPVTKMSPFVKADHFRPPSFLVYTCLVWIAEARLSRPSERQIDGYGEGYNFSNTFGEATCSIS